MRHSLVCVSPGCGWVPGLGTQGSGTQSGASHGFVVVISALVVQHGLPPVLPIIPLTMFVHYQVHGGMDVASCSKHATLVQHDL